MYIIVYFAWVPYYMFLFFEAVSYISEILSCSCIMFCVSQDPATENELTGANNLMAHFNLEHSYNKFTGKKVCAVFPYL